MSARPLRLAVVCDFPEEGWPSMDLFGEMIAAHLAAGHADEVAAARVCPPFRARLGGRRRAARNADRLLNRFVDYPRALGRLARRGEFDLYHIVDHSYAQLVHALPAGRAVVTCHDLDTFRCLLDPAREPRPRWFRAMAGRILSGLQQAAAVVCDSEATRLALRAHDLVPAERLRTVYAGVSPEFAASPRAEADAEAERLLGPVEPQGPPELLHVGSTIPRKRIDVLLEVFAALRRLHPDVRLVRVGGPLTDDQEAQARALGVAGAIATLPRIGRDTLAAVYRRATLVLLPSEAEGFGLPLVEALACGAPVLASDLPVLREVGGEAAVYRPVADVPAWIEAALAMLDERRARGEAWRGRLAALLAQAARFSWANHARQLVEVYHSIAPTAVRPVVAAAGQGDST